MMGEDDLETLYLPWSMRIFSGAWVPPVAVLVDIVRLA